MSNLFWLAIAVCLAVALLSAWDWWRLSKRETPTYDETIGRDQYRAESIVKIASYQGKAAKGISEESKRAHLQAVTKVGDSR